MKDHQRIPGVALRRLLLAGLATVATISCGDDPGPAPVDGAILVGVQTTGEDFDSDGYLISVNNGQGAAIGHQDTIWVTDLEAGDYEVSIGGLTENCNVPGETNPQETTVVPGDTVDVLFNVTCEVQGPPGNGGGGEPTP